MDENCAKHHLVLHSHLFSLFSSTLPHHEQWHQRLRTLRRAIDNDFSIDFDKISIALHQSWSSDRICFPLYVEMDWVDEWTLSDLCNIPLAHSSSFRAMKNHFFQKKGTLKEGVNELQFWSDLKQYCSDHSLSYTPPEEGESILQRKTVDIIALFDVSLPKIEKLLRDVSLYLNDHQLCIK